MTNKQVINILDLPTEMLHRILLFVPKRYNAALVCRKMYEAVCAVEFNKIILKTVSCPADTFTEEILPSIMNTKRIFDEMHFLLPEMKITKQIIQKFGTHIKKVRFMVSFCSNEDEIIEMLTLMPNLQQLRMGSLSLNPLSYKRDYFVNLRNLSCIFVTAEIHLEFFAKALPENILVELHFHLDFHSFFVGGNALEELLKKQTTIQKLHVPSCYPSMEIMQQLKLTELTYNVQDIRKNLHKKYNYLKDLLSCQPNLVYINLINYRDSMFALLPVDSDIMRIICNMKNLEMLFTNIDKICIDAVLEFSHLKKLKYLQIMSYRDESIPVLEKFSLIENLPLETFNNQIWYYEIPAQIYIQMGQNFKSLKRLVVMQNKNNKINLFLENFPNLETLKLCFRNTGAAFVETFEVYSDNRTFPKMKRFKIDIRRSHSRSEQKNIDSLKNMMPNVTVFEIKEKV